MRDTQAHSTGAIIAFPDAARRPQRVALRLEEPRGQILLFTGVRYERLDTAPSRPLRSDGSKRRRRS